MGVEWVLGVFVIVMASPDGLQAVELMCRFEVANIALGCVSGRFEGYWTTNKRNIRRRRYWAIERNQ